MKYSALKPVFIACSLCLYICTDHKFETAYKQAIITALIQNISLGREKGLKKREFKMFSSFKPLDILLQN